MAYTVMAYTVMAYVDMSYVVAAYMVMVCIDIALCSYRIDNDDLCRYGAI